MPNTNSNLELTAYQGIAGCCLNTEMSDQAVGRFVRFTVAGVRALSTPATPTAPGADAAIEEKAGNSGRKNAGNATDRRGRKVGDQPLWEMVYAWLTERGEAVQRPEIISHFEGLGYKSSSVAGALNDIRKGNRATSQNGLWQAIPASAQATIQQQQTAEMPEQQMLRDGTRG